MNLVLKALTKYHEDWGAAVDDFHISFQVDIGPEDVGMAAELFTFDVVSPKRLQKIIKKTEIVAGRGYLIMNDFNVDMVTKKVHEIILKNQTDDFDISMKNLSRYFRWEME